MNEYVTPCNYKPCTRPSVTNIDTLIPSIATKDYITQLVINPTSILRITDQITKIKKLEIYPEGQIVFDLYPDNEFYIFVVEKLIVHDSDIALDTLKIGWYQDNIETIISNLKGDKGEGVIGQINGGYEGKPGGTGFRGKTRHSPDIFFFFKDIEFNNSKVNEVKFDFLLKGIKGGKGGDGGIGGNGKKGRDGNHGRADGFGCKRGKNGGSGGAPGRGGRGGDGGCGGKGAHLFIYYLNSDFSTILDNSIYDVSGGEQEYNPDFPNTDYGLPGDAGVPGPKGIGGRRHGNCSGGHDGNTGTPAYGTPGWKDHNLGRGLTSVKGFDGEFDYEKIANYYRVVFDDPNVAL